MAFKRYFFTDESVPPFHIKITCQQSNFSSDFGKSKKIRWILLYRRSQCYTPTLLHKYRGDSIFWPDINNQIPDIVCALVKKSLG